MSNTHLKRMSVEERELTDWAKKDDQFWRETLTPLQYEVTRKHGTEQAFCGLYALESLEGTYHCSCCGQELFHSQKKYESHSGWPSYFDVIDQSQITLKEDRSFGMIRTEVSCSRCRAHLGHLFDDGPPPTGLRYCINSVSLIHEQELN